MAEYTSNVLIILTEDAYKQFKHKISAIKSPEKKQKLHELLADAEILMHNKSKEVLLKFMDVCWDTLEELEPAVYFINSFVISLNEWEYHYIISGEELSDINMYGTLRSKFLESVSLRVSYREKDSTVISMA